MFTDLKFSNKRLHFLRLRNIAQWKKHKRRATLFIEYLKLVYINILMHFLNENESPLLYILENLSYHKYGDFIELLL